MLAIDNNNIIITCIPIILYEQLTFVTYLLYTKQQSKCFSYYYYLIFPVYFPRTFLSFPTRPPTSRHLVCFLLLPLFSDIAKLISFHYKPIFTFSQPPSLLKATYLISDFGCSTGVLGETSGKRQSPRRLPTYTPSLPWPGSGMAHDSVRYATSNPFLLW